MQKSNISISSRDKYGGTRVFCLVGYFLFPSKLDSFYNILYLFTLFYIFYQSDCVKCLWLEQVKYFQNSLILPTLTPRIAISGICDSVTDDYIFKSNKVKFH